MLLNLIPKNLDDEFDEGDSEPGFVSELEESEVDSDDIEDNDANRNARETSVYGHWLSLPISSKYENLRLTGTHR